MGAPPVRKKYAVPSIQTVYSLYLYIDRVNKEGVFALHCKNVIKIPIAESVQRQNGFDNYIVTPYTAIVLENADSVVLSGLKIVIETNEGVTVEPIVVHAPLVWYDTAYLLTLPRGTTGIKKAYIIGQDANGFAVQDDLVFDIMEAPYNYENYLFALNYYEFVNFRVYVTERINELENSIDNLGTEVTNLKARVTALENNAGN